MAFFSLGNWTRYAYLGIELVAYPGVVVMRTVIYHFGLFFFLTVKVHSVKFPTGHAIWIIILKSRQNTNKTKKCIKTCVTLFVVVVFRLCLSTYKHTCRPFFEYKNMDETTSPCIRKTTMEPCAFFDNYCVHRLEYRFKPKRNRNAKPLMRSTFNMYAF